MHRSQSPHASQSLLQSRSSPRKIEMNDHASVLKIHPLAQQIGCQQKIDFVDFTRRFEPVCDGSKTRERVAARDYPSGNACARSGKSANTALISKFLEETADSCRVLRESNNPNSTVCVANRSQ